MTTAQTQTQTQTLPAADTAGSCAVCPHPLAAHDTISLRFCSATAAQASSTRGCVCPST
jgi:hypothetical protein